MPRTAPPERQPDDISGEFDPSTGGPWGYIERHKRLSLVRRFYAYPVWYRNKALSYSGSRAFTGEYLCFTPEQYTDAIRAAVLDFLSVTGESQAPDPLPIGPFYNLYDPRWGPNYRPYSWGQVWRSTAQAVQYVPGWLTSPNVGYSLVDQHDGVPKSGLPVVWDQAEAEYIAFWGRVPNVRMSYTHSLIFSANHTGPLTPLLQARARLMLVGRIVMQMACVALKMQEDTILGLLSYGAEQAAQPMIESMTPPRPITAAEGVVHDAYARASGIIQAVSYPHSN
jgi:hypothetical protein